MDESNRSAKITVSTLSKSFPVPDRYDTSDWMSQEDLWGRYPWFDWDPLDVEGPVRRYESDGWFLGDLPLEAVESWAWRQQFACRDTVSYTHLTLPTILLV